MRFWCSIKKIHWLHGVPKRDRSKLGKWLTNVVMVKKANGKWRMCVDFTDLNRACPKDSFPLPRIDQLVDSTTRHKLITFMDAFSGYNQIRMAKED